MEVWYIDHSKNSKGCFSGSMLVSFSILQLSDPPLEADAPWRFWRFLIKVQWWCCLRGWVKIFIDHLILPKILASVCMFLVLDLNYTCPGPVLSDFGNTIIQAGWKIVIGQIDFHLRQILSIQDKIHVKYKCYLSFHGWFMLIWFKSCAPQ